MIHALKLCQNSQKLKTTLNTKQKGSKRGPLSSWVLTAHQLHRVTPGHKFKILSHYVKTQVTELNYKSKTGSQLWMQHSQQQKPANQKQSITSTSRYLHFTPLQLIEHIVTFLFKKREGKKGFIDMEIWREWVRKSDLKKGKVSNQGGFSSEVWLLCVAPKQLHILASMQSQNKQFFCLCTTQIFDTVETFVLHLWTKNTPILYWATPKYRFNRFIRWILTFSTLADFLSICFCFQLRNTHAPHSPCMSPRMMCFWMTWYHCWHSARIRCNTTHWHQWGK